MLPISVIIATLNEENNIAQCLDSVKANNPSEIIVIDGGSSDKTVSIAMIKGANVIEVEKLGVAYQQQVGIETAKNPYIAIVDAFDRLEYNCLSILLDELNANQFDAIQAFIAIDMPTSYCQKAYAYNATHTLNVSVPEKTIMCGRPAIFKSEVIKKVGFDWKNFVIGMGCVDTDISIRLEMNGYSQGKGTGVSHRNIPLSFITWIEKMVKYGKGDALLIKKYPQKKWSIRKHQLFTYPIERSCRVFLKGGALYIPFFILFGYIRYIVSITWRKNI